ncbi:hypothetical protein Ahia01_001205100 [Argonauta hians]
MKRKIPLKFLQVLVDHGQLEALNDDWDIVEPTSTRGLYFFLSFVLLFNCHITIFLVYLLAALCLCRRRDFGELGRNLVQRTPFTPFQAPPLPPPLAEAET